MTAAEPAPTAEPAKPTAAGLYDAYLGGVHHTLAEKEAAERLRGALPELEQVAAVTRSFHQRATRWLAEQGIRQFIDLGSGLPTQDNTHQVVQRVNPDAKVAYVDIDSTATALGRELLVDNPNTVFVNADIRQRDAVLEDPGLRALIDLDEPVGLLASAVFHFVSDTEDPWGLAASYADAVAPGSYLALSHVTGDRQPATVIRTAQSIYRDADEMMYFRSRDQVEWFFTGLEMVPPHKGADPKVTFSGLWDCEDPVEADDDSSRWLYVGVARID